MTTTPIGIIRTSYTEKDECPIQPLYDKLNLLGYLEIFKEYEAGLKDIETFSHIYLLYQFDRAGEIKLVRPTFLDDKEHGIFASRHPCRPNGIGMSIVKLKSRTKNILEVEGIDILDGTPLLDIKPYLPQYDMIHEASEGWTGNVKWQPKPKGRE
ncbi:MAG: tRNA (N6-threonylcarbamoyladenosine(37)-N6)-methyltransferase TrmO [Mariprofundales bacterium]